MTEAVIWGVFLLAGVALGGVFFGGLRWSTRRGLASHRPALWFGLSAIVRTGVVLAGFGLVLFAAAPGDWHRLFACGLGFVAVQAWMLRLARSGAAAVSRADSGVR